MSAVAALLLAVAAAPEAPVVVTPRVAEVEVTGPTRGGMLTCAGLGTEVAVELADGELRRLTVPFAHLTQDAELAPVPVGFGAGAVRFLGWADTSERAEAWRRVPAGLRSRPLPTPSGTRRVPTPTGLALLAAALVSAAVLVRRPRAAAAVGLAAAAATLLLPTTDRAGVARITVLEGDAPSGAWVEVTVSTTPLEVPAPRLLRLGVLPASARVRFRVDAREDGPAWTARAHGPAGARLVLVTRPPAHELELVERAAAGSGAEVEVAWRRSPSGLVEPASGGASAAVPRGGPPGWLVAGLSPGREAWLARVGAQGEGERWIRLQHD